MRRSGRCPSWSHAAPSWGLSLRVQVGLARRTSPSWASLKNAEGIGRPKKQRAENVTKQLLVDQLVDRCEPPRRMIFRRGCLRAETEELEAVVDPREARAPTTPPGLPHPPLRLLPYARGWRS